MSKRHQSAIGNIFEVDMVDGQVPESYNYRVELPWPPSKNELKGKFSSKRAKAYYKRTEATLLQCGHRIVKFSQPVRVNLIFCPPDKRYVRDLHNYEEATFDALQWLGILKNDSLAVSHTADWGPVQRPAKVIVTISVYGKEER